MTLSLLQRLKATILGLVVELLCYGIHEVELSMATFAAAAV